MLLLDGKRLALWQSFSSNGVSYPANWLELPLVRTTKQLALFTHRSGPTDGGINDGHGAI